jgi:hypothetical protein
MRSWGFAILSTVYVSKVVTVDAFWLPQQSFPGVRVPVPSRVRLPETALQVIQQNGIDLMKQNIKFILVPTAKKTEKIRVAPADTVTKVASAPEPPVFTPEPVAPVPVPVAVVTPAPVSVVAEVAPAPPAPVVKIPEPRIPEIHTVTHSAPVRVQAPAHVPVPKIELPAAPKIELPAAPKLPAEDHGNSVIAAMQENYKNSFGRIHNAPHSTHHEAPLMVDYIKDGKFSSEAAGITFEKLKHAELNFDALNNMKRMNLDPLKETMAHFDTAAASDRTTQLLQLNYDKMMAAVGATGVPVDRLATSFQHFGAIMQSGGWTRPQEAIDSLELDELGSWYVGIVGLFLVISQNAHTATSSAAIALGEPSEVVLTESQKMEAQIIDLTKTIKAMAKELKALQIDKATKNYETTAMKSEMRDLRTQLEGKDIVEGDLTATLKRVEVEKVRIIRWGKHEF